MYTRSGGLKKSVDESGEAHTSEIRGNSNRSIGSFERSLQFRDESYLYLPRHLIFFDIHGSHRLKARKRGVSSGDDKVNELLGFNTRLWGFISGLFVYEFRPKNIYGRILQ